MQYFTNLQNLNSLCSWLHKNKIKKLIDFGVFEILHSSLVLKMVAVVLFLDKNIRYSKLWFKEVSLVDVQRSLLHVNSREREFGFVLVWEKKKTSSRGLLYLFFFWKEVAILYIVVCT
jgi:hypothetical protein